MLLILSQFQCSVWRRLSGGEEFRLPNKFQVETGEGWGGGGEGGGAEAQDEDAEGERHDPAGEPDRCHELQQAEDRGCHRRELNCGTRFFKIIFGWFYRKIV